MEKEKKSLNDELTSTVNELTQVLMLRSKNSVQQILQMGKRRTFLWYNRHVVETRMLSCKVLVFLRLDRLYESFAQNKS